MTIYRDDQWRNALNEVTGAGWLEDEAQDEMERVLIAAYNSDEGNENEDSVTAVIEACAKYYGTAWSPSDLAAMMVNWSMKYGEMYDARAEHVRENYPGTEVDWYKDDAPIWDGVFKASEVVVELDHGPVHVFLRPDSDLGRRAIRKGKGTA